MKLFLDINHPSHFHFFKNFILKAKEEGHEFLITSAEKDCLLALFQAYDIPFHNKGPRKVSFLGKTVNFIREIRLLYRMARKFKPDLFLSFASPYAALAGFMLNKPVITFDDTEADPILHRIFPRFSDYIITSESYEKNFSVKHLRFNGYKETEYLKHIHDEQAQLTETIEPDKPFIFLRFVRHSATHEFGQKGFTPEEKVQLVKTFNQYGQVRISSEEELPEILQPYKVSCSSADIHHLMAKATLFFGESATMAAEAAVLGVQSILIEAKGRGYIHDLEKKYGLVKLYKPEQKEEAIQQAIAYLEKDAHKKSDQEKHRQIIDQATDLTAFLIWLVDEFPESLEELKWNPELLKKF